MCQYSCFAADVIKHCVTRLYRLVMYLSTVLVLLELLFVYSALAGAARSLSDPVGCRRRCSAVGAPLPGPATSLGLPEVSGRRPAAAAVGDFCQCSVS